MKNPIYLAPGIRVGAGMIRISITFFYDLGAKMRPLAGLDQTYTLRQVWSQLLSAQNDLVVLQQTEWFSPAMKAALLPLNRLVESLRVVTNRTDYDSNLDPTEAYNIVSALSEFETILKSELLIADAYFVTRKAAYDTGVLVQNAEICFAPDLVLKVPGAVYDIREAGKCLAFELNTAVGFHIMRATEAVIRKYWDEVTGGTSHPHPKTIGTYANKLRDGSHGDKKVWTTLKQISDLHRNPLIHPEDILDQAEAISLFGICNSAISAMLKVIPEPKPAVPPPPPPLMNP